MTLPRKTHAWIAILFFLFLWGELVRQLGYHWSTNSQYAFGWTVPLISLFLLWESWSTRPAPDPAAVGRGPILTVIACALLLLPTRLLLETTPDWRFAHWAAAFEVIGLTLGVVWHVGGRAWLRHFAFPIAFILVAVPWPVKIEQPFIQMLTGWVATLTVGGLNLCQIPAIQQGNLIEISTGVVGVEEACSGVRSFQATLMASLFLGQLWEFRWRTRLALVAAGAALAFATNVARASFLAIVADKSGLAAIEKWHDPAGFAILAICFLGLLGLALLLRPKSARSLAPADIAPAGSLSGTFVAALGAWLAFVAIGTEIWYRIPSGAPAAWWSVEWPAKRPGFVEIPMTDPVLAMKFDEGRQGRWRADGGVDFTMFFFRWLPGDATSRIAARWHNPEVCLAGAGFKYVSEFAPVQMVSGEAGLVFRTYQFDSRGKPVFVFFCVWEDRKDPDGALKVPEQWSPMGRLRAVLQRKRRLGQQTLEVAIAGVATAPEALAAFHREIAPLVHPEAAVPREAKAAGTAARGGTTP